MLARSVWRAVRLTGNLLAGAAIILVIQLLAAFGRRPAWTPAVVRWWHQGICRALDVELRVTGTPETGALLVANHISWLDIPVLGSQGPIGFLSKAEIRRWPLIGWMAELAGTRFIERGANRFSTVAEQLVGDLAAGRMLLLFPEGTTSDGCEVRRFYPRPFGIVQQAGVRLQPVALAYRAGDAPDPDTSAAYTGDDTLPANLRRLLRHPRLVVHVQFLPAFALDANAQRKMLAARARNRIVAALQCLPGVQQVATWHGASGLLGSSSNPAAKTAVGQAGAGR